MSAINEEKHCKIIEKLYATAANVILQTMLENIANLKDY